MWTLPKSIKSIKRNNTWNIRLLVDDSFVPSSKQPSVIYCRLTDFITNWPWFMLHVWRSKFSITEIAPNAWLSFPGLSDQPHNLHFLTLRFFWQRIQQVYLLYCLLAWLLPSSQHHKAKTASSSTRSAYTPHMCFYCQLYLIATLQFLLMLC